MIGIKRAYEPAEPGDGKRILVERLWPRGVKKEALQLDEWAKEVSPSPALRTWYGHRQERWPAFVQRYRAELEANPAAWEPLLEAARRGRVTFVIAAKEKERSSAAVLRDFLAER